MNKTRTALAATATICLTAAAAVGTSTATDTKTIGRIGPSLGLTANGRALDPAGQQTTVGNFPGGSALSPDGKFLWAVASGHGPSEVTVVKVSDGSVTQHLPLPGSTGNVAFSPDGTKAYVSGISRGNSTPGGPVKGSSGDVIHVFSIGSDGAASEADPISLPANPGGGQSMPSGVAVSPDGTKLAVALLSGKVCLSGEATCSSGTIQSAKVVIVDLTGTDAAKSVGLDVGGLTHGVAFTPDGSKVLATDETTGTLDVITVATGAWTKVGVGGPLNGDGTGDKYSHPGALVVSPDGAYAYVAVANRDLVARVKLSDLTATFTNIGRSPAWGVQPVGIALSGNRLFVADSGEDAIAVLDLSSGTPALIGRIPTAAYPTGVSVSPDGTKVVWTSGKGYGTGPNGSPGQNSSQYIPDMFQGKVGVLDNPTTQALAALTARADAEVHPTNFTTAPPKTALTANGPIKHVFYIIKENRTYDQILGDDSRGDGDPTLTEFGDNGLAGPAGGITPNAHSLARKYPLLDHFYSNSEVSVDGHLVVSMGMAIDTAQRRFQYSYSDRGYSDVDFLLPASFAPKVSLFDQAVRQGVSAANLGEVYAGSRGNDGRSTFAQSKAMELTTYPLNMGCGSNPGTNDKKTKNPNLMNSPLCNSDSSANGLAVTAFGQKVWHSRVDLFKDWFKKQLAANTLPALTVIWLPNDHTNGTGAGNPTPRAMIADNDLGLGQLVQAISKSSVWKQSAIFSVEDDSQAGMDHVDGHRQVGFVISPWAKKAAVVHTRYDQDSMLRSAMMLLGLQPLTLADAFATPMYDAFMKTTDRANTATYTPITPTYPRTAVNTVSQSRRIGALSEKLPYDNLDSVPQPLFDAMLWKSVFGNSRPVPKPGPNSSPAELARNAVALKALRAGKPLPFGKLKRDD